MFSTADTIVAIATPPGRGGIGVVRMSGASALEVSGVLLPAVRLAPRRATFARVSSDHVVATYFPAPRSYTGEDVIEISAHGSPVVLGQIVAAAMGAGARLAEPGEFTLRAFLNGRMDLIQAEAVADLIDAVTPLQARAAFDQLQGTLTQRIAELDRELFDLTARLEASLDFPDEGYHFIQPAEVTDALRQVGARLDTLLADAQRGRLIREGAQVAIVGAPNVGKSSLFNALLQTARAIVTPIPGTTRDLVTETVDVEGLRLQLVDTAGMREASDEVEREGVSRAKHAWMTAELVVVVLDVSRPLGRDDRAILHDTAAARRLVLLNKIDLPAVWGMESLELGTAPGVALSLKTGEGVPEVRTSLRAMLGGAAPLSSGADPVARDPVAVTNIRHEALLRRAREAIRRTTAAVDDPDGPLPEELLLIDLQDAREALEEVTGKRTSDDLLRHIFERFCIGK